MGCCLLSLFLTLGPRLAVIFMWLFTDRVNIAFENALWALLGLIFLPLTIFAYVLVYDPVGGVTGLAWAAVVIALIVDLSIHAGTIYGNRKRVMGYVRYDEKG